MPPNASYGVQMNVKDRLIKRRDVRFTPINRNIFNLTKGCLFKVASTYIYCRVLIEVVTAIGKDSLDEVFGNSLEATMFSEFARSPDLSVSPLAYFLTATNCPPFLSQLSTPSPNQRANSDLFAKVLGQLSRIRYIEYPSNL